MDQSKFLIQHTHDSTRNKSVYYALFINTTTVLEIGQAKTSVKDQNWPSEQWDDAPKTSDVS